MAPEELNKVNKVKAIVEKSSFQGVQLIRESTKNILLIEGDSAKYPSINEQTPVKKKFIVEGKLELLIKCVESFSKPIPQPGESSRNGEKTKLARPTHNIDYGEVDL